MNKRKLKMDYIGVLSSKPATPAYRSTFKYFNKYLITLGEPTAAPSWTMFQIMKHAKNIIIDEHIPNSELMIDSGGFQIIVDKITKYRVLEYIECYHEVLKMYPDKIQKIFSLDINNFKMTAKEILEWNYKSTQMTIDTMQEFPELKDKVLFVIQNRNARVFKIWKELFLQKEVYKHFNLFSFGGLVNLKKETKVDFNHAVPATMWLLAYQKHFNFEIKQLHWLGQSSKVVFIAMALLEKLYGIYLTADSSELIRFAPIDQKLPLIRKEVIYDDIKNEYRDDFCYATNKDHVMEMLKIHSWDDDKCFRANRDNLKALGLDIDILDIVPQDILDYLLFVHLFKDKKSKDILETLQKSLKTVEKIIKALIHICSGYQLTKTDLKFLNYQLNDDQLKHWNTNTGLDRESFLAIDPELAKFYDYAETIKNFKYKDQRSSIARDLFESNGRKRLDNPDQIELICQHIDSAMMVADIITDKILEHGLENLDILKLKEIHPIMAQGKTAKTTLENIEWILKFRDCVEKGDILEADNLMLNLVESYER